MTKAFDSGYEMGVQTARAIAGYVAGRPSIPASAHKSAKLRNAFGYGFAHGFQSVMAERRPA